MKNYVFCGAMLLSSLAHGASSTEWVEIPVSGGDDKLTFSNVRVSSDCAADVDQAEITERDDGQYVFWIDFNEDWEVVAKGASGGQTNQVSSTDGKERCSISFDATPAKNTNFTFTSFSFAGGMKVHYGHRGEVGINGKLGHFTIKSEDWVVEPRRKGQVLKGLIDKEKIKFKDPATTELVCGKKHKGKLTITLGLYTLVNHEPKGDSHLKLTSFASGGRTTSLAIPISFDDCKSKGVNP